MQTVKRVAGNPFQVSVEKQIEQLRWANQIVNLKIDEKAIQKLLKTAPKWPRGPRAFRYLTINAEISKSADLIGEVFGKVWMPGCFVEKKEILQIEWGVVEDSEKGIQDPLTFAWMFPNFLRSREGHPIAGGQIRCKKSDFWRNFRNYEEPSVTFCRDGVVQIFVTHRSYH